MGRRERARQLPCWGAHFAVLLVGIGIGYGVRDAQLSEVRREDVSNLDVLFSPRGGCTEAIVREISEATQELLIQAYSFTSKDIAAAVSRAAKRGVRVTAILDTTNRTGKYSAATFLDHAGVPVLIDGAHAIAHNKVMVIDRNTVITGSFNFSRAAEERNAENLLVIRNAAIAERYRENFLRHKGHSETYIDARNQ
ncbi:MAG: phospholipase D family protein [Armatimonadetes bacterium]|nr:phospholipase D family protein [Armatimonadota bacterium]PIU63899.1 MAG: phospholipase D family protein [Armatimonadetes bacterium CG07_land_8_20_14_0_80_59_28]PIX44135.1 MAG: phospholipase D family protein [Armatimonadetes bacterium CG_4_8_14_3_um_filter_58_9]PIY45946.1 MAG: phospholipase D family protein [Armatimonadetes bacterium CG_4_10_14_3_um_filter_59_10]PJB61557.1 MAG: phospholipase D family protein [Armatimonadetes bacterium CG_4_9_14_3_um_filter_58_7]